MRLPDFILCNVEPILHEWETFARSIWPTPTPTPLLLRDHAEIILRATVRDMGTAQTDLEQTRKSKGTSAEGDASADLDDASKEHALARVKSGFHPRELIAEYRALRASVIRLWGASGAQPDLHGLMDLTRFNESIDQSLSEAVRHFSVEVDRSREMFLGILGHDLRNPLNAILLSAEALVEISTDDSAQFAAQIVTSGEAMARLLADFMDFTASRLGAGMPLVLERADLALICRTVAAECSASFPRSKLVLDLGRDLEGKWDAPRLRQLLSNLIGNAIQHGSAGTPIHISALGGKTSVQLRVQNAGEPIPAELLPSIFDPLVHAPGTNGKQRRPGSMGLGLYIAKEVVSAHGGDIQVTSSAETGTVFTTTLPRAPAAH